MIEQRKRQKTGKVGGLLAEDGSRHKRGDRR